MILTGAADQPLRLDQSFFTDPHALHALLREQRPVQRVVTPAGLPVWLVTRYEDVRAALADPRLGKDGARFAGLLSRLITDPRQRMAFAGSFAAHMLNSDPPDHTRLRNLVNRAFTVRAVAALRPRIETIAGELLDALAARPGVVDLLDGYAFPLPMRVICEILGVDDRARDQFRAWSHTFFADGPPERRASAVQAISDYLAGLIAAKRVHPGPDMLSEIVQAGEGDDRLSEREAVSMAFLLLVAGHETTVNLIGNGMLALLCHPGQLAALRADRGLIRAAVEEFLRFEGPLTNASSRHTLEPVTIGGVEIPAGELVLVSLSAANRDGARFARPDELDLRRDTTGHLAFGYGIHHCLGAPLARLEGEVAFGALLDRFPDIRLAVDPAELTWRASFLLRGLERLPVHLATE